MKRVWFALACAFACSFSSPAAAQSPAAAYGAALAALQRGADDEAIDRLELLADQGVVSESASLARAAAYLARADGENARPGDLGRAAAALGEALLLEPDDAQAERALDAVQAEIARRRSKQQESVMVRPRLGRAVVGLLPEQGWAWLAALSSLSLAFGIVGRRLATRPLHRLSSVVAASVGGVLLLIFGGAAYASEQLRQGSQPAVVVVPEARLTSDTGRPLPYKRGADTTTVPEGATVYVKQSRDGRYLVEWGSNDGWLSASDLRLLAAR